MAKWITFEEVTLAPHLKTKMWSIRAIEGGGHLGHVRWWPPWRKYTFWPNESTLYEPTCLNDIAAFLSDETAKHKAARKS